MTAPRCWCGRPTRLRTLHSEMTLSETKGPQVRECPKHGEFWQAKDRPQPLEGMP